MIYNKQRLTIGDAFLPITDHTTASATIQNLGVKKFRSLLKKKLNSEDFEEYQVKCAKNFDINVSSATPRKEDPNIIKLEEEFKSLFCRDLLEGLPPEREIDHKIETEPGS